LQPRKKIAKGGSVSENFLTLRLPQSRVFYFLKTEFAKEVLVSAWLGVTQPAVPHLVSGSEGGLVSVRVSTDPRHLEDVLECLARVSFPINPELFHGVPTIVEFPAYEEHLPEVSAALKACGFDPSSLSYSDMLERIAG
jgi:hypothetical protein